MLLAKAVCYPTEENKRKLDHGFKQFFFKMRFIKYISNLIYYHSIDLDKRYKNFYQRHSLILDKPIQMDDNKVTFLDVYHSYKPNVSEWIVNEGDDIFHYVENPKLYQALKTLSNKQLKILELFYVRGLNNKAIAEFFGESPQNISKIHHKALNRLKNQLDKG
ncbi:RNA polymerase sigma factor (sigma-70 family) [Scopulibacillus daqui]|uniref:RNA polymerase sigma factor (Sigma-70 family) n=1 Tax=Scopulibacillus daqui TaxID=1469162 RepID=A0ABS2Q408_9BACL|nr:RNA polymerase sigma factor (sigma-70 family) [Scopulibacillus daqui]